MNKRQKQIVRDKMIERNQARKETKEWLEDTKEKRAQVEKERLQNTSEPPF